MRRFSPVSGFSLYFITGLVLSVIFIWIFGEIAESVLSGDTFVVLDKWVMRHLLYFRTTNMTSFMEVVTNLGGTMIIAPCGFIIAGYLLFKRHYDTAAGFAVAVVGGMILNNILKALFHRPRPLSEAALTTVYGWSFPSGHAMNSTIFYGMLVYLIVRGIHSRPLRLAAIAASMSIVFIIGLSRIYLQVHYLSDVIAGLAGGLFWLSVCITGVEMNRKRGEIHDLEQ